MATTTPQTPLAAGVAETVRVELARRDATTAQIMDWTGLKAQTARSRRRGDSDWTLAELSALARGLGLIWTFGAALDPSRPFDPTRSQPGT
jgi:hypothetical protein